MTNMRIVHLNSNDMLGGAAIAAKRLRDGQRELGHEALLLVGDQQKPDAYTVAFGQPTLNWLKFVWERLYFRWFEKSKSVRFAFSPLVIGNSIETSEVIQSADILHLHWINFGYLSGQNLKAVLDLKKPTFITLHDMWWITGGCHHAGSCDRYTQQCGKCTSYLKHPKEDDLSHRQFELKQWAMESASIHWIACSEWLAKRVRKSTLGQRFPVSVIPNPLDMSIFMPGDKLKAREKWKLEADKFYVLIVAAKLEVLWKGIDLLIEATAFFPQDTELLVVGQMEESTAAQCHVPVRSLGIIRDSTEMAQVYQAADVFALSSRFENLPNTIMEAMGSGIPCVGFSIGGIPEMIDHQHSGYVAQPFDVQDFATGIEACLENKKIWGHNAWVKATRTYKKEVVVQQILDLYTPPLNL